MILKLHPLDKKGAFCYNTLTMKQLDVFEQSEKSCVFTGHRTLAPTFSVRALKKAIGNALKEGYRTFYNGMAMGFDLLAAETLLFFKKKYPDIRFIACIPCPEQEKYFCETDKERYRKLLSKADEKIFLSDHYYNGCMQKRNRYMVERADLLIGHCVEKRGGAAYTLSYFEKSRPYGEVVLV